MTCPTCAKHAALLTSSEYEDAKGEAISDDTAVNSRDIMIHRCRESNDASRIDEYRSRGAVLHSINRGLLVPEYARPLTSGARSSFRLLCSRLSILAISAEDSACTRQVFGEAASFADELADALGEPRMEWGAAMRACIREHQRSAPPAPVMPAETLLAAE